MSDDTSTSLCAVFAILIEEQLRSGDPDMGTVFEQLDNIKKHCSMMPTPAGETPEHLEEYQFGDDPDAPDGTVEVDRQTLPATAVKRAEESQ